MKTNQFEFEERLARKDNCIVDHRRTRDSDANQSDEPPAALELKKQNAHQNNVTSEKRRGKTRTERGEVKSEREQMQQHEEDDLLSFSFSFSFASLKVDIDGPGTTLIISH
jgi:hypothetical protein